LDGNYTVFGEVLTGMDVVDKIAKARTNRADRPREDIWIEKIRLIK
ncbi:MAG: peptidylprolyl isomerase, partial [Synergistaceae bacterium]|nr:peptidylprolyl isomerase [Synergistaceae bacterium]